MYDSKHRFHVLSAIPERPDAQAQSGLWEYLLCERCEAKLSLWESYASRVLGGGLPLDYRRNGDFVYVSGLDYSKLRLFQLSILWRAAVSSLKFFERVDLGAHAERIRKQLLEEDAGRFCRYGCLMFGLRLDDAAMSSVIIQPSVQRLHGHRAYRFVFGGFLWLYLVSSHDIAAPLSMGLLRPSGELVFLVKDARGFRDLENFARDWVALGRNQ